MCMDRVGMEVEDLLLNGRHLHSFSLLFSHSFITKQTSPDIPRSGIIGLNLSHMLQWFQVNQPVSFNISLEDKCCSILIYLPLISSYRDTQRPCIIVSLCTCCTVPPC